MKEGREQEEKGGNISAGPPFHDARLIGRGQGEKENGQITAGSYLPDMGKGPRRKKKEVPTCPPLRRI